MKRFPCNFAESADSAETRRISRRLKSHSDRGLSSDLSTSPVLKLMKVQCLLLLVVIGRTVRPPRSNIRGPTFRLALPKRHDAAVPAPRPCSCFFLWGRDAPLAARSNASAHSAWVLCTHLAILAGIRPEFSQPDWCFAAVPQVAVRPGKEKADPDHRVATGLRERDPLREPVVTRDPTGDYRTSLVLAHGPHTVAPGTTALATLTTPSTPGVMGHTGTFLAYTDRLITQAATEEADTEDRVVAVREDIIENIIRRSMSFIDRQLANNLRDLNTTDILNRVRTVRAWLGYTCAPGLATCYTCAPGLATCYTRT